MIIKDVDGLIKTICEGTKQECDVAIVGVSGGIDSSLILALCTMALGKENVYAYSMPYDQKDLDGPNKLSKSLAEHLAVNHKEICIKEIADAIVNAGGVSPSEDDIDRGNARARARMCVLYKKARILSKTILKKVRVVGGINLSKSYLGYSTKNGDMYCDFAPLAKLYKHQCVALIYELVKKGILTKEHFDPIPKAGFYEGQTDEVEIGIKYNLMAEPIRLYRDNPYLINIPNEDPIVELVRLNHLENNHKNYPATTLDLKQYFN